MMRSAAIAAIYGALAGALAAVTLWCMNTVNHWVWSLSDARWYIPVVIMLGGILIALIRNVTEDADLNAQLAQAHDVLHLKKPVPCFWRCPRLSRLVLVVPWGRRPVWSLWFPKHPPSWRY